MGRNLPSVTPYKQLKHFDGAQHRKKDRRGRCARGPVGEQQIKGAIETET